MTRVRRQAREGSPTTQSSGVRRVPARDLSHGGAATANGEDELEGQCSLVGSLAHLTPRRSVVLYAGLGGSEGECVPSSPGVCGCKAAGET